MAEGKNAVQTDAYVILSERASELWQNILTGRADWIYWLGLIPVFMLSWYVRTRNLPLLAGRYLVELDSYFFFRYAKTIFETGSLPAIDMMRYSPLGFPTSRFGFFPETMAFFYKYLIHPVFPNMTQIQWHIYYPPIITLISFVFFFLFVKELFGHRTALASTAFLAVIPAYIQRTSAGFADHEAMAMLWMFVSLWLFILMWKSASWQKSVVFGLLSGLFTGVMSMTWGGYSFLISTIALFFVAAILFRQINKCRLVGYFCWAASFLLILSEYFSIRLGVQLIKAYDTGLIIFSIAAAILFFYLPKIKYISREAAALTVTGTAVVVLIVLLNKFGGFNIEVLSISALKSTFTPSSQRWATTVAESQQSNFGAWIGQYGWIFWLAIIGGAISLYKIFEIKADSNLPGEARGIPANKTRTTLYTIPKQVKYSVAAAISYFAFVFVLAGSGQKEYTALYLPSLIAVFAIFCTIYLAAKRHDLFSPSKSFYLLSFIFVFIILIMANTQLRLLFAFAPPAAIASGLFVVGGAGYLLKYNKTKILALVFAAAIILIYFSSAVVATQTNQRIGSMIPGQWEGAMTFLREQTPQSSVVAHWWDYGHMTAAVGERATVTDGGNVRSWNHASGRYFLTGKDKTSTLEYLKSHNVTHILISDQEIPKYPAFSLIGSDENFDRYSTISAFVLQDIKEARYGTMRLYGGSWSFDNDVVRGNLILPAGQASIKGVSVLEKNNSLSEPKIYVTQAGRQFQFDLSCIYKNGTRINFSKTPDTMNGCIVLVPYFEDATSGYEDGAAFWVSEKVWDTNLARLYLYEENDPNFKLVYKDQTPTALYKGNTIGPIRIWEVVYPADIMPSQKYLEYSPHG